MELTRLPDGQVYALRYTLKYAFGDIPLNPFDEMNCYS